MNIKGLVAVCFLGKERIYVDYYVKKLHNFTSGNEYSFKSGNTPLYPSILDARWDEISFSRHSPVNDQSHELAG